MNYGINLMPDKQGRIVQTTTTKDVGKVERARMILRLESSAQKDALQAAASKAGWTLNAEVLHRCFSPDYKPAKQDADAPGSSEDAKLTLRFDTAEQKTELMQAAKQHMRSLNAEIVFRCFH